MEEVKEPNKPKMPGSAFFIFMEEFRKQYKRTHPNIKSVAAVGKAGGEKWRSLSDAEKAPYVAEADERKVKYEDMKPYNERQAEGGGDNFVSRIMEKVEDRNKPIRPSSAFSVFMEEFRKQYNQKHPRNKSVAAVPKAGGDKWKSLSDAEKAPYVAEADERKAEHEKDKKAHNKRRAEGTKEGAEESKKSRPELIIKEEDDEGSDEEEDDNFVFRIMEKVEDPNKPKRPSSAFFVFMEEFRKQYEQKHPHNRSVAAVGKAGGDKWKSLSDAEKAPYVAEADERKAGYQKNMKAYAYRRA